MKYEVFNPQNGIAIFTTRSRIIARLVAWSMRADYAQQFTGWIAEGYSERRRIGAEVNS